MSTLGDPNRFAAGICPGKLDASSSPMTPELGKILVIVGAAILVVGLLLWSGFGAGWIGRLPGDIRIERGNSAFYFPIVTCLILSLLLSLLFALFRR